MIIRILFSLLILSLASCTTATTKINEIHQNFVKSFREPGEEKVASAKEVYEVDKCKGRQFSLESMQVIPENTSRGDEINQRLRYVYCSPEFDERTDGVVTRTIYFRGDRQFRDVTYYTYKPGTWNIDVFVEIPDDVAEGRYTFEVVLEFGSETFTRSKEFTVKK